MNTVKAITNAGVIQAVPGATAAVSANAAAVPPNLAAASANVPAVSSTAPAGVVNTSAVANLEAAQKIIAANQATGTIIDHFVKYQAYLMFFIAPNLLVTFNIYIFP